jgi:hypothetical protein
MVSRCFVVSCHTGSEEILFRVNWPLVTREQIVPFGQPRQKKLTLRKDPISKGSLIADSSGAEFSSASFELELCVTTIFNTKMTLLRHTFKFESPSVSRVAQAAVALLVLILSPADLARFGWSNNLAGP